MLDGDNASVVVILATVSLSLLTVDLDRSLLRAPISPVNLSPPFCAACLHQHFRLDARCRCRTDAVDEMTSSYDWQSTRSTPQSFITQ